MKVIETEIPDVRVVTPRLLSDSRGVFVETYNEKVLAQHGIQGDFVQDNHSVSATRGTVRGLHFQIAPYAQDKLIRVVRGSILDVAVDIRRESPTFGRSVSVILSAREWNQLYIPAGFAHGFCTLEDHVEVVYKVTNFYASSCDFGLLWNDPDLSIDWPVAEPDAILSEKDTAHPRLRDLPAYF